MIRIEFSVQDVKKLDHDRYHHPHPKIQKKMEVLYLKAKGLSHREICRVSGVSHTTLVSYLRQYAEGGHESLKELRYQGRPNELSEHKKVLQTYFHKHPPRNISEACLVIEKLTGITRKPTQIRIFLKRIGIRVDAQSPCSADKNNLKQEETGLKISTEQLLSDQT